ncbi:hypothetical protein [Streptomyces sp. LN785]|uniref:hypothetical protein n=1 Tax=Streptomyces sp. LN785 TaxID=3112983 RepID=UPI00371806BE
MNVAATERHIIRACRCRREPWVEHLELAHGAYRFELSCWWREAGWTKTVTVVETSVLVRGFVDQALAAAQSDAVVLVPRAGPDA